MRETLSLNIDSCYRDITTLKGYPKYDPVTHILSIKMENQDDSSIEVTRYRIGGNGAPELIKDGQDR